MGGCCLMRAGMPRQTSSWLVAVRWQRAPPQLAAAYEPPSRLNHRRSVAAQVLLCSAKAHSTIRPPTTSPPPLPPPSPFCPAVNGTSLLGFDGRAAKVQQGSGSILHILSWPGWRLTATLSRVGPSRQSMALSSVLLRGPRSAAKVAVNRGRFSGEAVY